MKNIALLLADGFEEIEAIVPIDILRRAGYKLDIVSITGNKASSGRSVTIKSDFNIDDYCKELDCIVIPGGMPGASNIFGCTKAKELIKETNSRGGIIAAICASPGVVLGPMGLLLNKKFTCYPGHETNVKDAIFEESNVVISENIITSRGAGTALDFALAIVEKLSNKEKRDTLAKAIIYTN